MTLPYRWVAEYYDKFFGPWRQPLDVARDSVLRGIMPQVKSACDLCCGSGPTALMFARKEITTYAVDLSPTMCRLVRQKAARSGLPVRVIRADMRAFRLPHAVDLITCEGDAINHVPNKSDLRKVAKAAARALRPGGHFFFDVNNASGFERYWIGNVWLEKPGVAVVMRNGHNAELDRAWIDIEWFVREGRCWRRHSERIEEVCWDDEEIRQTLRDAGFDRVRSWDSTPFWKGSSLVIRGCRTNYLARKARG